MSSSSSDDNEDFNVFSSEFNPLATLYSPETPRLPHPSAPVLDNVEKLMSVLLDKHKKTETTQAGPSTSAPERNFKPEQMPLPGTSNKIRGPNLLTYMDRVQGPLSLLRRAREEQLRVRVYTRGVNYLRGHMDAYLLAFDKHWNLALLDVDEVFKRRRFPKGSLDESLDKEEAEEMMSGEKPASEVLLSLFNQVVEARSKLKLLKDQMEEMEGGDTPQSKKSKKANEEEGDEDDKRDYKQSALVLSKETKLLASGVIEEIPRDDGTQYFLAIAELQKNINNLRELKSMGERILGDNMEYAKMIEQIENERNVLDARMREDREKAQDDKENENNGPPKNDKEKEPAARELTAKIRATQEAYEALKLDFGVFLQRAMSEEWSPFCTLLQELWDNYVNNLKRKSSDYMKISHLDFDVDQRDINKLISEGIVLVHPEDTDQIKLIEFKR